MPNPVGRPTDYTPELLEKAHKYIAGAWAFETQDEIPSHIGLAKYLNIMRSTLYDWETHEDKKEFSDILREVKAEQQSELLNKGLNGTFNSAITKLVLGKHGFHEKKDTELTGSGGGPVDMKWTVEIVDVKEE